MSAQPIQISGLSLVKSPVPLRDSSEAHPILNTGPQLNIGATFCSRGIAVAAYSKGLADGTIALPSTGYHQHRACSSARKDPNHNFGPTFLASRENRTI